MHEFWNVVKMDTLSSGLSFAFMRLNSSERGNTIPGSRRHRRRRHRRRRRSC